MRPHKPPRHLADLEPPQRRAALVEAGEPAYRAEQLARNYFAHYRDLEAMTDVPAGDRERLAAEFLPPLLEAVRTVECDAGQTRKTLWRLGDGSLVESVLMRYPDRATMCVSSQAGCGMGCPFCATGQAGLTRNLSAAEIVEQVVVGGLGWKGPGGPCEVDNIVFMGMGEPLANYPAVIRALHALTEPPPAGLGIGRRHITVSTVGLVPGIDRLAKEGMQVNLAISLHAPDDELRDTLVPVNLRWNVAEVLEAAWRYAAASGRRISFEYAMIRDVNDQPDRAHLLGSLLAGRLAHVNLIPLNPTPGSQWTATTAEREREMVRILRSYGVPTTVRDTRGREIDGACGQLAATVSQ